MSSNIVANFKFFKDVLFVKKVHEQEKQERVSRVRNLSRQAVKDLENTNNLLSSALCYEVSGLCFLVSM